MDHKKICFVHMPKCGGTSIIHALKHPVFNRDSIRYKSSKATKRANKLGVNVDEFREQELIELLGNPKYNYVSGHYRCTKKVLDEFQDNWAFITLLRDPVKRWFSHYFYNRYKMKSHYKTRLSLEDYVKSESGQLIGSMYVRFLSGNLESRSDGAVHEAFSNLKRYDLVGTLENQEQFISNFEDIFGRPLNVPHKNQSPASKKKQRDIVTDEIKEQVEQICEPDMRIYKFVSENLGA